MRKTALERRKELINRERKQLETDLDGLFRLMLGGDYNPTQKAFIYDQYQYKLFAGAAGSAKTSTLSSSVLGRALLQPGSKHYVSRQDYNDLCLTTMHRMEEMIHRLPKGVLLDRDKSPPQRWYIAPVIPDADHSEITFLGLSDPVVGIEANSWSIDEMNEAEQLRVEEIKMRLRAPGGDYCLQGACNLPQKTHWLYTACTGLDFQERKVGEPWMKLFTPIYKENAKNLPEGYYENLLKTLPVELAERYVLGNWGSTFEGQPVYREFKERIHVRNNLKWSPDRPLLRFWDFGYNRPACIWAQLDWEGRLLALRELVGSMEEATKFARHVQSETTQRFPGINLESVIDYGDPAVRQQKDTGRTLNELLKCGIMMRWQLSTIEFGTKLIRQRLQLMIDEEPALQFDRRNCPILIDAMRGGYRLDKYGEKAVKDGFYEHSADAYRYGVVNVLGQSMAHTMNSDTLPSTLEYNPSLDRVEHPPE